MGIMYDSIRDTVKYVLTSKSFLMLALVLFVVSVLGIPFQSIMVVYVIHLLLFSIAGALLGGIIVCLFKEPELDGAVSRFSRLLGKFILLNIAEILISVFLLVSMAGFLILAVVVVHIVKSSPSLALAVGIFFAVLAVFGFGSLIYVSLRLSLALPFLLLEEAGVIDSLKKSWELSRGKVITIFATSFLFGILYSLLLIPAFIVQGAGFVLMALKNALAGRVIELAGAVLLSFLTSFYILASYVLTVMLFKNISKSVGIAALETVVGQKDEPSRKLFVMAAIKPAKAVRKQLKAVKAKRPAGKAAVRKTVKRKPKAR